LLETEKVLDPKASVTPDLTNGRREQVSRPEKLASGAAMRGTIPPFFDH
jgi:hypothetical protein